MFKSGRSSLTRMIFLAICSVGLFAGCSSEKSQDNSSALQALEQQVEELEKQLEVWSMKDTQSPATTEAPATTTTIPPEETLDCEINVMPGTIPSLCGVQLGDEATSAFITLMEKLGLPTDIGWSSPTCRGGFSPDTLEQSIYWDNLRVSFLQEPDPDFDFSFVVYSSPYVANWIIDYHEGFDDWPEIFITPDMVPLPGGVQMGDSIQSIGEAFNIDIEVDGKEGIFDTLPEAAYLLYMNGFMFDHSETPEGQVSQSISVPDVPYCH